MRNIIFDRRRAERFAQLLDEADGGPRHHGRSRSDEQLAELVALGHGLTRVPPGAEIAPDFRTGLRAMLVATAEREGVGYETEAGDARAPVACLLKAGTSADAAGRRLRARGAVVVGVIAGAVAVSGMSAASSEANPGDALYSVKRQTERAQLALAGSDEDKGRLFLEFAAVRLREARAVTGDADGFSDVLHDMDSDTREGVKLLAGAATRQHDSAPLEPVDPFVTAQRRQLGGFLDSLTGKNRDRALDSLILLDSVDRRSEALVDGLTCPARQALPPTDALGPLPNLCGGKADDPVGSPVHGGGGQRAQEQVADRQPNGGAPATGTPAGPVVPAPADPTAAPSAPVDGTSPDTVSEPLPEQPQQPSPAPSPTPGGKNVLEDLLGGLLGG